MGHFITLIVSVAAQVIGNILCKWLSARKSREKLND